MRLLLTFSYDGSKFNGFQRQKNVRSVQKEIEDALKKIYNKEIEIKGAGRTDAGVHGVNQCAHFDVYHKKTFLKKKLNNILMPDIKIKCIEEKSSEFHARHSAKAKVYEYKISYKKNDNDNYYLVLKNKLDTNKMREASKLFIGHHNYENFVAGKRDNYETYINGIFFKESKNYLIIEFMGMSFYRYMVRNLVGALIEVGKGKIDKEIIQEMLDNPSKEKALPTASPNGLYLKKVIY